MNLPPALLLISSIVFIFGAIIGSFLNVCIARLPKEESIVSPPSHCPLCKSPIAFYDNIPLISYIYLRGRCRSCREKISPRYFVVEFLMAFFAVLLFSRLGLGLAFFVNFVLVAASLSSLLLIWMLELCRTSSASLASGLGF